MRRISFVATAIAAGFLIAGLSAQGKPDFSGKWTLVVDPNAAPPAAPPGGAPPGGGGGGRPGGGGGGGGQGRGGRGGGQFCGQECTITQDATSLTVTRMTQAGEQKATYKLDGSESKNAGGRGGEVVSKAAWEGNKITISTAQPGRDGGPGTTVKTTVGMNGGQMEVETDAGRGANKQTYKKG